MSRLKNDLTGPILCFVGPPGVGKTSLGQSIARTLGRKFVRISVGGVRDEAEIRGHRRTYIGAMPGTILRALRDAESSNPVFLIDEIDKMGSDFRGDPASAMLEVLDPEQHSTFRDHYLDLPFDLSKVLFICTANQLETIPGAAARPHGRDPALRLHGGGEARDREALPRPEAARGARADAVAARLQRPRAAARDPRVHARGGRARTSSGRSPRSAARRRRRSRAATKARLRVDEAQVREWLGPRRFSDEVRKRTSDPGVATGLAVTAVGGDVLFVEASAYAGEGRLKVTGQLGDVMQESAQAAHSWVRAHAEHARAAGRLVRRARHPRPRARRRRAEGRAVGRDHDGDRDRLADQRPARLGARRDDGRDHAHRPGAADRRRPRQGARRPARRACARSCCPRENEPDLEELPAETREALALRARVDSIDEVLDAALDGAGGPRPRRGPQAALQRCSLFALPWTAGNGLPTTNERTTSDGEYEGPDLRREAVRRAGREGRGGARERARRVPGRARDLQRAHGQPRRHHDRRARRDRQGHPGQAARGARRPPRARPTASRARRITAAATRCSCSRASRSGSSSTR